MRIKVIHGPNLNLLGIREPDVYGTLTYRGLIEKIKEYCESIDIEVDFFQSNSEGSIIDAIHDAYFKSYDGIIINPGAYTHYSYAIRDALASIKNVVLVEVHLSNIYERESFRRISVISAVVDHRVIGQGYIGYYEAVDFIRMKKT